MFRVLTTLLLFIVGVGAFGNNECITKEGNEYYFENCNSAAEISMKWKLKNELFLILFSNSNEVRKLKLVVNDKCELKFEGKKGDDSYATWTKGNETVANCSSIFECSLQITNDGKLETIHSHIDVGCDNVLNKINDTWVWSKFRVEDLPAEYFMNVHVGESDAEEDEGSEHFPPSTTTATPTDTPKASTSSIVLDVSIFALVAFIIFVMCTICLFFLFFVYLFFW
ncbi:hypothetical protein M3Y95_01034200 [Aphelenchoides besseyi]|nr:hypothetical protein M3Y95_01034200 [Aphelenchoides besseyi]